jgi:hypothetical protein
MASKKKIAGKAGTTAATRKAGNAADTARPYVQRLIEDDDLRENLREAYEAGRHAYERASGAKRPFDVLEDKKLGKDLRNASESLRAASEALREPQKKSGGSLGKLLLIAIVGAVIALAVSEDLRKKVLDQLFGAEEEFEYTSTTSSPSAGSATSAA